MQFQGIHFRKFYWRNTMPKARIILHHFSGLNSLPSFRGVFSISSAFLLPEGSFFLTLGFFLVILWPELVMSGLTRTCFFCGKSAPQKVLFRTYMYWRCFLLVCFQCVNLQEVQNLNPGSFLRKIWGAPTHPRSWEAAEIFGRLAKHLPFLWEMTEENELRFGPRSQRWVTACICVIYVYIYSKIIYMHIVITHTRI